jgi:hypothetical protein
LSRLPLAQTRAGRPVASPLPGIKVFAARVRPDNRFYGKFLKNGPEMWAVSRFMPVDVIYPEPVYGTGMQLA